VLGQIAASQQDTARLKALQAQVRPWLDASPDDVDLHLLLADINVALERVDEARTLLAGFCGGEPGSTSVPALMRLQELCRQQGDFEAAQRWLAQADKLAPDSLVLRRQRLLLLDAMGDQDALVAMVRGFDGPSLDQAELCATAANLLAKSPAHRDQAIEFAHKAADLAPDEPRAFAVLGELLYSLGDQAAAEQAFRSVLRLSPNDPDALNNVAWVVRERGGDLEEAAKLSQKAISLAPDNADFHNTLGYVLEAIPGRENDAVEAYRRSIALAPSKSPVRANSLLMLARLTRRIDRWESLRPYLPQLRELRSDESGLNPEDRHELDTLIEESETKLMASGGTAGT